MLLFAGVFPRAEAADTVVPISGIGTHLNAPFVINTRVDAVTYSGPETVELEGFGEAFEMRGTVSGIGWGGVAAVARASNAHYAYDIPFVARWRKDGTSKDLVMHFHGGNQPVTAVVLGEKLLGPENTHRFAELGSDFSHGLPALLNHCAYVSTNRRGLRGDGTFSATYLPSEIAPLTATEAAALNAAIAAGPGNPGFVQPGIIAGAPVPLTPTTDAPTFRDISRALQEVVGAAMQTRFRTRICTGHSSGTRLSAAFNFGRSTLSATLSARTGGNYIVPYQPASGRIFDAFILYGLPAEPSERVDATLPISAPTFCIIGRGDERYQQPIHLANELLAKGVSLNDWLRIYEVKGLTHLTRDLVGTVQPSNGDALGCFVSAAIRNIREWMRDGIEPPLSRIAGRIQNGTLVFDVDGGATTNMQPILENPAIDSLQIDAMLTPRLIGPAETARWQAVTAVLAHEADSIIPPAIACRLGGYRIRFFGATLLPFAPETLEAMYGSFEGYKDCVEDVVAELEAARLYDPRVESAKETAELSRPLFAP
jgi:hypothetical protein